MWFNADVRRTPNSLPGCSAYNSLIDWGVLSETGDKGVYSGGKPTFIEEPRLIVWMVETFLHARENEAAAVNDLLDNPGIFPMIRAYWQIGCLIVENEQQGRECAEYGKAARRS